MFPLTATRLQPLLNRPTGYSAASRRNYKLNVIKLEAIATQLAEHISLHCNVEDHDHRAYRLSAMLLQPMMKPAIVGQALRKWASCANVSALWQFAGGFARSEADRTVKGPLWVAIQNHCINFIAQPWVASYIDVRCRSGWRI